MTSERPSVDHATSPDPSCAEAERIWARYCQRRDECQEFIDAGVATIHEGAAVTAECGALLMVCQEERARAVADAEECVDALVQLINQHGLGNLLEKHPMGDTRTSEALREFRSRSRAEGKEEKSE